MKDIQPQIGGKTAAWQWVGDCSRGRDNCRAHDRINNLIDHVGRIGKYRRSPFVIGAAGNSAVPTADARTGQANHRGFVRFSTPGSRSLGRVVGIGRVVVVCWKTMAKRVNGFCPVSGIES